MKIIRNILFITIVLLSISGKINAQHSVEEAWNSGPVFKFSEGVIPSEDGTFLYVSNTVGSPMERDGQGTISTVTPDGKIINADWITGMNAPKGIQRYKNLLYVADLNDVVVIDIEKAAIVHKIKIDSAMLLHQFAIDENGIVYVSDMFGGKIHRIENNKAGLYLDGLGYAAGMLFHNGELHIVTGGNLVKVSKDKKITTLASGMDNRMNGIQHVKDNEFLATSWAGIMYYIKADGTHQVLFDHSKENRVPAGIMYYDKSKNLVYMTSDDYNTLFAYKLK